jgi:hypothetical protein
MATFRGGTWHISAADKARDDKLRQVMASAIERLVEPGDTCEVGGLFFEMHRGESVSVSGSLSPARCAAFLQVLALRWDSVSIVPSSSGTVHARPGNPMHKKKELSNLPKDLARWTAREESRQFAAKARKRRRYQRD